MSRLCLKMTQESIEMNTLSTIATINPNGLESMPLTRFMPKNDATSVGNIRIMVTLVSVRMMVFMLLLIILW